MPDSIPVHESFDRLDRLSSLSFSGDKGAGERTAGGEPIYRIVFPPPSEQAKPRPQRMLMQGSRTLIRPLTFHNDDVPMLH